MTDDRSEGPSALRPDRGSLAMLAVACILGWLAVGYLITAAIALSEDTAIVGAVLGGASVVVALLFRRSVALDRRTFDSDDPYLRADAAWRPMTVRFRLHPVRVSAGVAGMYCAVYAVISSLGPVVLHRSWVHPVAYAVVAAVAVLTVLAARTVERRTHH